MIGTLGDLTVRCGFVSQVAKRGVWVAVRGPEGRTIPSVVILVGVLSVFDLSGSVLIGLEVPEV